MPRVALTSNTLRLVRHLFQLEQHAGVVEKLEVECASDLPFMSDATPESLERIRFAVLKLSKGSAIELARAIALAKVDWRDVLVAAQFANDLRAHEFWLHEELDGAEDEANSRSC